MGEISTRSGYYIRVNTKDVTGGCVANTRHVRLNTVGVAAGLPDDGGCDLSTNEDAQNADPVGGKHADDGEGER